MLRMLESILNMLECNLLQFPEQSCARVTLFSPDNSSSYPAKGGNWTLKITLSRKEPIKYTSEVY